MNASRSIIGFYSGLNSDDQGRYLTDLQRWPDDALEATHDFIQWMFPLKERSGVNPSAPTLNEATIEEFRSRPELKESLRVSFVRMLRFYGLELTTEPLKVGHAPDFQENSTNWLSPWNHNHLRITRILKSLSLLGLEREAQAFLDCLSEIFQAQGSRPAISMETFRYWRSSVPRTHSAHK